MQCCDADVRASIDTGCQHNSISGSCCRRLGTVVGPPGPCGAFSCSWGLRGSGSLLGSKTLLELKCCVDLSRRVLRLQGSAGEELPFQASGASCGGHHDDTDENL
ncbi:hypothetical protein NHX12_020497 [Muraenolepis orangiensis]|uniref:Uncharacterized protein n=1 Tax=Muraenolepis orangiensis TaxID=630683 RepID=A0A9Q0IWP9_9TELE|nr:hypothetical protein NHX12_020497 [Muraenolepis orangiensis]